MPEFRGPHRHAAMTDFDLGNFFAAITFTGAITALIIVILSPLARKVGLVDCPSGRKQHEGDIPLIGGIAIFLGFIAGLVYSGITIPHLHAFVTATSLLFVIGIIDDYLDIPAIIKLIAQIIAALIMVYWAGLEIEGLSNLFYSGKFSLGNLSVPLTVIAVVGYTNAINMSDGVDGLAGSLTLTATLALMVAAYLAGYTQYFIYLGIFAASIVVFLIFNARHPLRKKAGIFLGDAGSLICGFIVSWFVICLATIQPRAIEAATALWIIAIPFIDLTAVMLKRMLRGKSPFAADREHFHHLLLAAGFSINQTVLIIFGFALCFAGFGLLGQTLLVPGYMMFYIFAAIFILSLWVLYRAWYMHKLLSLLRQNFWRNSKK